MTRSNKYFMFSAAAGKTVLAAALFAVSLSFAQAAFVTYQWTSEAGGNWNTLGSWSPATTVVPGTAALRWDAVAIDKAVTVSRSGELRFRNIGTDPEGSGGKSGRFDALALTNGAKLVVDGRVDVASAGAGGAYIRNVLIGEGSALEATSIETGTSNNSSNYSTWDIRGTVLADSFIGVQGSSTAAAAGRGYVLDVNGGSFKVGSFTWGGENMSGVNAEGRGEINISQGGIVDLGIVDRTNWRLAEGNFVNLVDATGSLLFSNSGWSLAHVEGLIDDNYIRAGAPNLTLQITAVDSNWMVTAVPEPATVASLLSAAVLGIVAMRSLHRRVR